MTQKQVFEPVSSTLLLDNVLVYDVNMKETPKRVLVDGRDHASFTYLPSETYGQRHKMLNITALNLNMTEDHVITWFPGLWVHR